MLHYNFHGAQITTDNLIILLHGFISDHSSFDDHIDTLNQHANVLTIDLPGHGDDISANDVTWDFDFIAQQLDEVIRLYASYNIYLHGYSMGGRVALYYALYGNMALTGLILESTSPGIATDSECEERQNVDNARAKVLEIAGLEIFVNDWEKLPLFYTQYELEKPIRKRIRNMRMNQDPYKLAKALRDYGSGYMPSLWSEITHIDIPVAILAGALDQKFVAIGNKMTNLIPRSKFYEVPHVGHTIHVEDASEFDKIVVGFLNKEEQND
ncbi:2-succinyl-6-hydroxy-2,4-cyclohexadiene-1-carboxylate synthase [Staphylococcus arlettae]|uniref:2-succinyl-6-hydroxy-2, 4-cyclohexadiene-1-carboxylate synthase n=1 Tax=Staphylococcus arlettae TaxID=29378 RepID=UPI00186B73B1|nr:2-succinyl-6-hydroxy-2,4-cyclohexadiene-1-carboxylate synthase [Staphylococcus arlettae]QZZ02859.1 2-succinyl-6-hydroxy-2,4-cyclohexadiene-1-carboxylate synthase [Staphylococcus arlettae]